ncbi:uroporphyrinogen-III C-methyltransferase [Ideonella sp. DXS29W]|uniref:Uroporphyrinogen-III C-methyltransferase n=1 Tax=Ideonella lacteola TaxID=2984193 RepID=A0ABU9BSY1_9BURK
MNAPELPSSSPVPAPAEPVPVPPPPVPAPVAAAGASGALSRGPWPLGALALAAMCVASFSLVWSTQQRVKSLEQELVRRQQNSQDQSTEARLLARQAHDAAADVSAKLGLLEARVAESALQRTQVEELIQSLSRSRDENVLADVEAALRVAQQQSSITGSAEPLVAVLKQADERLARYNQPRLERVRRAVARDLDRVRAVSVADVPSLSIKLDEAVRLVDELPLLVSPERKGVSVAGVPAAPALSASGVAAGAGMPGVAQGDWLGLLARAWNRIATETWAEVRSLVRVTRIDQPEAMLLAPEQAYFLRENLKLRLLNARLSLLSRQFEQAQGDLMLAQTSLDRYFDRGSRRVSSTGELLRQVSAQARQASLPRPDETLAALAAASAGR